MKKIRKTDDNTMVVFNLDLHPNAFLEFPGFLCDKVSEMHGEKVNVISYKQWHSSSKSKSVSVLVEFPDSRQRNLALSIKGGVEFYGRTLRAEIYDITRQRGGGYVKKKQYICNFFSGGRRCRYDAEFCRYAHGVLDLKLYADTQLQKERCVYINQIDHRYSSNDLLNLIKHEYRKQEEKIELIITALHQRQQMGDALIEFGNPYLASKAHDFLNDVKLGSQQLATHTWESGYQNIFINYFDKNIQTEIKVQKETPPIVAAALAPQISPASRSEHISEEIDSARASNPRSRQVHQTVQKETPSAVSALPRRISHDRPKLRIQIRTGRQKGTPSTAASAPPRRISADPSKASNLNSQVVETGQEEEAPSVVAAISQDRPPVSNLRSQVQEEAPPVAAAQPRRISLDRPPVSSIRNQVAETGQEEEAPPAGVATMSLDPPKASNLRSQVQEEEAPSVVAAQPRRISLLDRPTRVSTNPGHVDANGDRQDCGGQIVDHNTTGQDDCVAASHGHSRSDSTSSEMVSSITDEANKKPGPVGGIESLLDVCSFAVRNHSLTDHHNGESPESPHGDTLDPAASGDSSEPMSPRPRPLDKEPETLVPLDDVSTRQVENTTALPEDEESEVIQPMENDNCPQEESTEDMEDDPRELVEPTESQRHEANPDMLEDSSNEGMQERCHPVPQHDIDRMRQEIAKLKSEQLQKDQLIEQLKNKNAETETQLDGSRKDARVYLEKLVNQRKHAAKMEEEVDRLRRENDDLRPKLKCKEELTKQLKVEVYDLLKDRCDIFEDIKKLCYGQKDKIKSGGDQVSRDHDTKSGIGSISLGTIREVKKHLEGISSYLKKTETENERLRDQKSDLEEELEQMRMCQALEEGFAGE